MHKTRNINLDLIKVLACIGVVLLHTTMVGFKETGSWNLLAYLYYLGTYSIPLFFMVNGYLLLGKRNITYSYILEKVKWILITVSSWFDGAKRLFLSVLVFWCTDTHLFMSTCFKKDSKFKKKILIHSILLCHYWFNF